MDSPCFDLFYLFRLVDPALTNNESPCRDPRRQLFGSGQAHLKCLKVPIVYAYYLRAGFQRAGQFRLIMNLDRQYRAIEQSPVHASPASIADQAVRQ